MNQPWWWCSAFQKHPRATARPLPYTAHWCRCSSVAVAPWQSVGVLPSTVGRVPRAGFTLQSRWWVEAPARRLHFGTELLARGAAGDLGQVGWSLSMAPSTVPITRWARALDGWQAALEVGRGVLGLSKTPHAHPRCGDTGGSF